jgi:hypothetical protein
MLSSDLAADCTLLDGSESVSVTLRRPEGWTTIVVAGALRGSIARGETNFDGVTLIGDETVWHVPHASLGADQKLQPGDSIAAGDEVWSIVATQHNTFGTRWRCACRKQP